ncbi:MAG: TlpA disulfide reductase family protein [Chitinophagaceae bacterium]
MKKIVLSFFVVLICGISTGQGIKKMSIGELEKYIRDSEKPLVVNFWATFCAPCVHEIPYFKSTINEKFNGMVDLILVSLDPPDYFPAKISSFASQKNFSIPLVWLNETNADYFCPRIDLKWSGSIPATLMVNNKKNYRKFYEQQLTPLQLERELRALAD